MKVNFKHGGKINTSWDESDQLVAVVQRTKRMPTGPLEKVSVSRDGYYTATTGHGRCIAAPAPFE